MNGSKNGKVNYDCIVLRADLKVFSIDYYHLSMSVQVFSNFFILLVDFYTTQFVPELYRKSLHLTTNEATDEAIVYKREKKERVQL